MKKFLCISRKYSIFIALSVILTTRAGVAQDADSRARDIVRQMTLDEKITELHGIHDSDHYRYVPPIPRLGIPAFHVTNGPAGRGPDGHGVQAPATALPAPIGLAATWNPPLAEVHGEIAGAESKDLGDDLLEAPTVNIARVPQNGRTFEGYGEDPFLAAQISVGNIQGIQIQGEIANVKHYAANNQETDRHVVNELIDERTLHEIYLPAFEASVREAQVMSVMCAYPLVNGVYCCENDALNQILRKEWGFDGFITSDFGAVHSTIPSAMAGLDLEMPTGKYFGDDLKAAVESGKVPMSVIDDKLIRRFRAMIRMGMFDHAATPKAIPAQEDGIQARRIAEEGIVLLKNQDKTLPLHAKRLKSLALIGPYATKAMTGGGGSSHVVPLYTVPPLDGIKSRMGKSVKISLSEGADIESATVLARSADVAIVMVGDNETEGHDHPITFDGNQDKLIEAVVAANPRTIVVVKSGSAMLMPWADKVPAILEAWYPGEEDGNAVAAVLFGEVNPSGKLPLTFPKNLADTLASKPEQYPGVDKVAKYAEGIFVGYRYYDANGITPLFPFGHGLSYTSFAYSGLKISLPQTPPASDSSPALDIDLDIQNTGEVGGAEVVQLYLGLPSTTAVPQPPKQLKGFHKVSLQPGQKAHIHFSLHARALSYWDINSHAWALPAGVYRIQVGSSSRDIRLEGQTELQLPKNSP